MIGLLMQSAAVSSIGLRPLATVRHTISRSVTTPMGCLLEVLSMIGISPQSLSTIILATSGNEVPAVQNAGSGVIMSLTCITMLLSLRFNSSCRLAGGEPAPPKAQRLVQCSLLRLPHFSLSNQ
jgi:hypothetical protein